ncbi:carbohydrate-binding protein [Flavivirga sp. 57AJ16]|uniref:carbohydrate-binding protein n=1 Tax=Flavivirga sp. 57AJ16 TaxID=3025307 RepID=UPI002366CC17|nr:carbohydrate-binding protein [Flavivirga sp. 57AJ16]MDD7885079.1 carbohydrate-binding protein [Flavivirga sp. 57AJ16]
MKNYYYLITFLSITFCTNLFSQTSNAPSLSGKILYHHYSDYSAWDAEMFILDLSDNSVTNISSGWNIDHEMNGVFSPDGTKIAFMGDQIGGTRNWDIFLWTVGGGEPVNLTNGGGRDEDPKFSPDGTKIVYKSNGDIYEMDLNGNVLGNLTNSSEEESMPFYTADGSKILFMEGVGSSANISIINVDGSNRSVMADNVNMHDYYPIVRDASSFFYTSWVSPSDGHDQLHLKYYSGSDILLPFNTSSADYSDATPVGSDYVVLSSTKSGGQGGYDLYIANINTGDIWSLDSYNSSVNSVYEDLGACYFTSSTGNQSPTVGINSPTQGTTYSAPASITISASASDSDGSIDYVDFYAGTTYLGTDTSSPYSYNWNGVVAGSYSLTAEAFDNEGASTVSEPVSVTVSGSSSCEYVLPLLIQAEDYCNMSGVVLETCYDTGGGQDVGGINTGDWMEYEVNVPTSATYEITYRIATTESGAQITAYEDGILLKATSLPATGGWQTWQSVTDQITLSAGVHTLRIENTGSAWNINWLDVANMPNQAPTVSVTSPTNGAAFGEPASFSISASASDSDGSIDYVDFYAGTTYLGTDTSTPYSYDWNSVAAGSYSLTAEAFDNEGASTVSAPVLVDVNVVSGCVKNLPQQIEAEDYCDMSGVATEQCSDTGGGLDVGGVNKNDWMEYDVNIANTGSYTVTYRIATPQNASKIQIQEDGVILATTTLPNTGGWQNWQSVSTSVNLSAGLHTIKIIDTNRSWNLNWISFSWNSSQKMQKKPKSSSITDINLNNTIKVFPNPIANNKIKYSLNSKDFVNGQVALIDIVGRVVITKKIEAVSEEISIENTPSGLYFLKFTKDNKTETKKILIE